MHWANYKHFFKKKIVLKFICMRKFSWGKKHVILYLKYHDGLLYLACTPIDSSIVLITFNQHIKLYCKAIRLFATIHLFVIH